MEPEEILAQARKLVEEHAGGDVDRWWYANRFVFARMMLDERKTKTAIKQRLLAEAQPCQFCGKPFAEKKNIHLHRLDQDKGYSDGNCVLAHQECHQKEHRRSDKTARPGRPRKAAPKDAGAAKTGRGRRRIRKDAGGILSKHSKRYDGSFLYWWDVWPSLAEILDQYEAVEFVCDDTGASCLVPVPSLKPLLTPKRQTSRGQGNWGLKVRKGHEDEIGIEPGKGKRDWVYVPVVWTDENRED